jgi:hypothetical protein
MVATTPATELRKRESGKLCLKGFCPCKQKVGKTGARLSAIPDKRKVQLRDLLGRDASRWPPELLLPGGTGDGKLGDVRVWWGHYDKENLNVTTVNGGSGTSATHTCAARPSNPLTRVLPACALVCSAPAGGGHRCSAHGAAGRGAARRWS